MLRVYWFAFAQAILKMMQNLQLTTDQESSSFIFLKVDLNWHVVFRLCLLFCSLKLIIFFSEKQLQCVKSLRHFCCRTISVVLLCISKNKKCLKIKQTKPVILLVFWIQFSNIIYLYCLPAEKNVKTQTKIAYAIFNLALCSRVCHWPSID